MNITFVNHHGVQSNSAIHIVALAKALIARGMGCAVVVPDTSMSDAGPARIDPELEVLTYTQSLRRTPKPLDLSLVYAWTPREIVRQQALRLAEHMQAPYVVHLEDNEEVLLEAQSGKPIDTLKALPEAALRKHVGLNCTNPNHVHGFLSGAAGVSTIIDRLTDFVPQGVPSCTIWPGYDEALFGPAPRNDALRRKYSIKDSDFVVAYTGTTHAANRAEVDSLYAGIRLAREKGIPVTLVRTGYAASRLRDRLIRRTPRHCKELGFVERDRLPAILSMADVLIQPGAAGRFNDFRFPSKLTEFFATGRPVILPHSNIGRCMHDGVDCLLLKTGTPEEIALHIERLFNDRDMASKLGERGRAFALEHFQWSKAADTVATFLGTLPPQRQ